MRDDHLIFDPALAGLEIDDWCARVEDLGFEHGHFEQLGDDHSACFLDAGKTLLVTFESAQDIRESMPGATPRGFAFAQREGWSSLSVISKGESWFRDVAVYRYFDRLIDDGFFEDFDRVLFHGAHAGGYAAAAYSVAAPGARVLAICPQATLDPQIAGWDTRFMHHRRSNFTDRYGYAPDMIDAAMTAYIVFSPHIRIDAMHAALFRAPNAVMLRVNGLGRKLEMAFDALDVHDDLIMAAMDGTLTKARFARLVAARKDYTPYQRNLVKRAIDSDHTQIAIGLCRKLAVDDQTGFFRAQLDKISKQSAQQSTKQSIPAAE